MPGLRICALPAASAASCAPIARLREFPLRPAVCRVLGAESSMQTIKGRWLLQFEWLFEPRDIWVGVYWKRYPAALEVYVCLLPIVPIRLYCQNMRPVSGR